VATDTAHCTPRRAWPYQMRRPVLANRHVISHGHDRPTTAWCNNTKHLQKIFSLYTTALDIQHKRGNKQIAIWKWIIKASVWKKLSLKSMVSEHNRLKQLMLNTPNWPKHFRVSYRVRCVESDVVHRFELVGWITVRHSCYIGVQMTHCFLFMRPTNVSRLLLPC
jgi:hypothetical protein